MSPGKADFIMSCYDLSVVLASKKNTPQHSPTACPSALKPRQSDHLHCKRGPKHLTKAFLLEKGLGLFGKKNTSQM